MKKYYPILFVIIASLGFSFIHCPLFEIYFDDKEIFKYTGLVLYKGGVPYRDFFDHKPPMIFFINYLGLLLGSWGLWIIDTLLVLSASVIFFRVCKQYKLAYAWLLPVIFNLMIRNNTVSLGIGMTREYTAIFLLIAFCVVMSTSRHKFWLVGVLTGLIFFTQQDQILPLFPFVLYALLTNSIPLFSSLLRRTIHLAAGFLLVTTPILLYFFLNHSFRHFLDSAFLFNFQWYNESMPLIHHAKAIRNALHNCEYDVIFYGSCILGVAALFYGNRNKWLTICALAAAGLSFCSELLSGKLITGLPVSYYFLALSATLPALLFVVFAFTERLFFQNKQHQLIYAAILSANLFFHILQYATNISPNKTPWPAQSAEFQYLKKQPLKDYDLYIFYSSNYVYLYNQFRILSPSKWIYHYFWHWYPAWDADNKILTSITTDLKQHNTPYILDFSDSATFKNSGHLLYWKSFLQANYTPVQLDTSSAKTVLWKIRSSN